MVQLPEVAIGSVVAALIAGLISLLGLIISKEQKVSDFRQAWIDALRSEIALVITHANAIHGAAVAGFSSSAELWKIVRPDFLGINEAVSKIRLRLNPAEGVSILACIQELEALLSPGRGIEYKKLDEVEKKLVLEAQALLKKEWRRVKDGERVFRLAKMLALAVIASGFFVSLLLGVFKVLEK
jgi:hypothetical protein